MHFQDTRFKIITPSTWLAGLAKQSFLTSYPVEVIHNGVDLKTFKPKAKEIKDDDHIILGVASTWDARKGLQDFIELRKILALDSKIVLIGLSDKQIEQLPKGIQGIKRTEKCRSLSRLVQQGKRLCKPYLC